MTLRDTAGLLEGHSTPLPELKIVDVQAAIDEIEGRTKDTTIHHLPVPAAPSQLPATTTSSSSTSTHGPATVTVPSVKPAVVTKWSPPPLNPGLSAREIGELTKKWRREPLVQDLLKSLRFRRPKGGPTEQKFIREFLDAEIGNLYQDKCGNIYTIVGKNDPNVLWSCHTDSVHRMEGEQAVVVDGNWIRLPENSKSNCLGADDMAGIWLLRNMIKAGVPGLYIFHYGEESGGIGSGYIAEKHPEYLAGIKVAIAFDRRNFTDVITHQAGGRCCSDEFAESLAKLLPEGYKPSSGGIFTDTANYTQLIPECTNVSVGYFDEHTSAERLNIPHILKLREALCKLTQEDLDGLVIKRDPKEPDLDDIYGWGDYGYVGGGRYGFRGQSGGRRHKERSEGVYTGKYGTKYQHLGSAYDKDDIFDMFDEQPDIQPEYHQETINFGSSYIPSSMTELCEEFPATLAAILIEYGFSVDELWDEMQKLRERNG